ncbi:MAG: Alpha/beta hydrolase [uncultured Sulfurovum sp.]|uniref:Alpha/beta hydrolase n=1 Tax=uncultured Sulfurovum sp. TaxID=269237 RepID=A0A6S6TT88_9BACT|nr:MAG: Alpha/beta hydrolase [uncultured Sulfurovum sp.]
MKILKILIFFSFSFSLYANNPDNNQSLKILCFTLQDKNESKFCQVSKHKVILLSSALFINQTISLMQKEIREAMVNYQKVILMGENFTGTLLAIAQTNLLPYFRQNIIGIVLKESPVNLLKACHNQEKDEKSRLCKSIIVFQKSLNGLASKEEVFIALSPGLQMDWYWSKTLIVGDNYKQEWIKALEENSIIYLTKDRVKAEKLLAYFPLKKSRKVQPIMKRIEPSYYGALLRFHFNKIAYESKHKIITQKNLPYGVDKLQNYDVYFKESSKNNPIMIYVHGGGWTEGDKMNYAHLAKQYADRGFTAVNINYRLLRHPKVSMKEMVQDVKIGIEHVLHHANAYEANGSKVLVMAESAGGQLASLAISKINPKYKISASIFNSMPTDLRIFSKAKQIRLSNIPKDEERLDWLNDYSPINQLHEYKVPTLIVHGFNDNIVPSKHLEDFEILSAIYANNIFPFWVEGEMHPIIPWYRSLQPSYIDIENESRSFINKKIFNNQ